MGLDYDIITLIGFEIDIDEYLAIKTKRIVTPSCRCKSKGNMRFCGMCGRENKNTVHSEKEIVGSTLPFDRDIVEFGPLSGAKLGIDKDIDVLDSSDDTTYPRITMHNNIDGSDECRYFLEFVDPKRISKMTLEDIFTNVRNLCKEHDIDSNKVRIQTYMSMS